MNQSFVEQIKISFKDTEIKYPKGYKLFVSYQDGSVIEFSLIENKIIHDHGQIFNNRIFSMAKTFDNKSQFLCDIIGSFKELDISTRKQANRFDVKSARCCVVTYNNEFLITASNEKNCVLTKWSIRAKKQLHTWHSGINEQVSSQSCSQDNKYQLIGHMFGWLGIFDLQKHQMLKKVKVLKSYIFSVAFSRDNQSAFISDQEGYIKVINWQAGASSGDIFDFTQNVTKVGSGCTESICLTKDEKHLLVADCDSVRVFETTTREVTTVSELTSYVKAISLFQDDEMAIIAELNGNLTIVDLKTMEISSIIKKITNTKIISRIAVI